MSAEVSGAGGEKVLIAVNNGISYLKADNFEKVFVLRAKRDTRSIDHAACMTVEHHQGAFDSYIFCTTRVHMINAKIPWPQEAEFVELVSKRFNDAITVMMKDQMNPELWKNPLSPVEKIRFIQDGVEYLRKAPYVPDSRFAKEEQLN